MKRKIFLYSIILVILGIWFYLSNDFSMITAWVAIFLFWMRFLQDWFGFFTWWSFERLLQKSTDKTWKSMVFWFVASTLMQSSSLVVIISVSFLSAELITLLQWIWILMWANIWTTTWAWLIAWFWLKLNIWLLAMPLLVFSTIWILQKNKTVKWIWYIFAWLWFVFLWIDYMKVWFENFSGSIDLSVYAMTWFYWLLIFTWIWILATLVMQSSLATIILVITALAVWQVSYENALAIVIWANIWTSITSFLVALTWNKEAKRLWLDDVIMKSMAWLIFILFFEQVLWIINNLSSVIWIPADNFPLKLALFHTLYNIVWVIVMLLAINYVLIFLQRIFPDEKENIYWSIYLNTETVWLPDTAIISLTKETRRLYYNAIEVILQSLSLKQSDIEWDMLDIEHIKRKVKLLEIDEINKLYNTKVKYLYWQIIDYVTLAQSNNDEKYYNDFYKIKVASRDIAEVVKIMPQIQENLEKYLRSTNAEIKVQYENIIEELLNIIYDTIKLKNAKTNNEKLNAYVWIQRRIEENDVINNWEIDKLIRERKISNEMATSLINDTNYKNKMFKNLLQVSEIIFNNDISDDKTDLKNKSWDWLQDNFWLTWKKLWKTISKLKKQVKKLREDIAIEKDSEKKEKMKQELSNLDFIIKKYEK